jgi:hypothetical protein
MCCAVALTSCGFPRKELYDPEPSIRSVLWSTLDVGRSLSPLEAAYRWAELPIFSLINNKITAVSLLNG